jgi:hypothetical protein
MRLKAEGISLVRGIPNLAFVPTTGQGGPSERGFFYCLLLIYEEIIKRNGSQRYDHGNRI